MHGGMSLKPDVHFRHGRIFPQDHLMNCKLENRHGQLTREAMYRMITTFRAAKELEMQYCGVVKQVQLKIYSTIINWYIKKNLNKPNWNPTGHIVSDSEIMRNIIYHTDYEADSFQRIILTCAILRRFETAAYLNRRARNLVRNEIDSLSNVYHSRDITAKDLVTEALKLGVIMFFAGHTRNDELYIPRYEFAVFPSVPFNGLKKSICKLLSALRLASFDVDEDFLYGLEDPIRTLVPTPLLIAHDISEKMGEELASNFAERATAEFIKRMREKRSNIYRTAS
jgi:hypothetical protein